MQKIEVKPKRDDMLVGTLETKSPLFQAFPVGNIGTLRNTMSRALGLPPAALELRMPDGTTANPKGKVARFLDSWGVA